MNEDDNDTTSETWEDRLQREIDITQQQIDQMVVNGTTTGNATVVVPNMPQCTADGGNSNMSHVALSTTTVNVEFPVEPTEEESSSLSKLYCNDADADDEAHSATHDTDTDSTTMLVEAVSHSIRQHRRLSSILDEESPSMDMVCNSNSSSPDAGTKTTVRTTTSVTAIPLVEVKASSTGPFMMTSPPEPPDSPERLLHPQHRRRHLVVENDEMGEGVNVVTIGQLSQGHSSSSVSLSQMTVTKHHHKPEQHQQPTQHQRRHSESFHNSLLDDEQSFGSERRLTQLDHSLGQHNNSDNDASHAIVEQQLKDVTSTGTPPRPLELDMEDRTTVEEKKEQEDSSSAHRYNDRHARFAIQAQLHPPDDGHQDDIIDPELRECLSATESEVASLDGLPSTLQHRLLELGTSPRERVLQTLDGIFSAPHPKKLDDTAALSSTTTIPNKNTPSDDDDADDEFDTYTRSFVSTKLRGSRVVIGGGKLPHESSNEEGSVNNNNNNNPTTSCGGIFIDTCVTNFTGLWNGSVMDEDQLRCGSKGQWDTTRMKQNLEVPLAILDCSNIIHQGERVLPTLAPRVHSSLVRVARDHHHNPSYGETLLPAEADPRMPDWIANQYHSRDPPPVDGTYHLGQSRTVIVHEINRGNWTWCTAWSPDGRHLAVATDNHELAVVDTTTSTVWRVRHDRKLINPLGSNTTRSIRTIDWGKQFIAIGGTGNVVSILSTLDPYDILHDIPSTGFVGCVNWRGDSNILAVGSRLDFVLIVQIKETEENSVLHGRNKIYSETLHRIEYKYWVNCVKFSPDGSCLAVGDAGGIVSVYDYEESKGKVETHMITWFKRKDSILSIEWSLDGKWLYAGGEDCSVTVVDTSYWEIVHRIGQDRWVQCIASSHGSSHVAIGGVSSEISILDVANGWDSIMGIELKGLVPLSAQWHPRDQYLVLTGQDNSVLVVETTNARHVKGHHLHSISPIRAIEFSPDGRMAIVGNEAGVVTFFSLSGTSFITAYELVIPLSKSVHIQWSLNGMFVVVGAASSVVIVSRKRNKRQGQKCPPNASGFSVKKVIGEAGLVHAIAIDYQSQYIAISGDCTRIIDVRDDFSVVQEWKNGPCYSNAWSSDGRWLAMMGKDKFLTIYDTSSRRADRWRVIFSMKCDFVGRALAWGPLIVSGLLYLAYGGDSNEIYIMEIRTNEGTWETVLKVKRDATINALDWSMEGLLAAGIGNGTVCIIDLAYLQSGIAVNEMDYEWQRQALTCYTEIRRNRGVNAIKSLRWLPAAPGSDRLLAVGGTDGEVEIIDLTEQQRCKGYAS